LVAFSRRDLVCHVRRINDDQSGLTLAQHIPQHLEILVVNPTLHMTSDSTNRRTRAATDRQPTDKPDRRKDRSRGANRKPPTSP
jgi:hypothetical protein